MSRIIVKNLPKGIKEEKFRVTFASKGEITDVQLKYTKDGIFRQFGFIGFKTPEQAQAALKFYNNTFVGSSKIQVEIARNLGDDKLPRPWSKYSQSKNKQELTSADTKQKDGENTENTKNKEKKKTKPAILEELDDDPEFQEFLESHKNRGTVKAWTNDATVNVDSKDAKVKKEKRKMEDVELDEEESMASDDEEMFDPTKDEEEKKVEEVKETKVADKTGVSDMDYLRSKVVKSNLDSDSSDEDKEATSQEKVEESKKKKKKKKKKKRSDGDSFTKGEFVVKMKGIPFTAQEKEIRDFMSPIELTAVRIPKDKNGKKSGSAFVEFKSEEDLQKAMKKNKRFMKGRCIQLIRDTKPSDRDPSKAKTDDRPWIKKASENADQDNDESIGESGRLFVRNLAYVCTEDDLEKLFSQYGPLTEVYLPIDSLTKKIKGFAFITYMMPEHAVQAYTQLDGSVFQGRMLHILPSKEKKMDESSTGKDDTSYKKQKAARDKALSASSHNWNTLFIGANAVVDAMAQKYKTSKSEVLDSESSNSLAVRVALGETQIVSETRQFLIDNQVSLDSFSQASAPRSNTVILVKNLPASTKADELRDVFSKFGGLGRVVLPPAGVTAVVEYLEPNEAKLGFRKLAYTKFQHVPLYLEWAPMGVFTTPAEEKEMKAGEHKKADTKESANENEGDKEVSESANDGEGDKDSSESEEEPTEGCTLFVKNLNFNTTEATVKEKFSTCGPLRNVSISKKKDLKNPGHFLSMGYGFVEFKRLEDATRALKELQHCMVDDHQLELKLSNRATVQVKPKSSKKKHVAKKQISTKILVRNLPFEATHKEIRELFSTFGEIKSIRLPKKAAGVGKHRGFGFVDFLTKQDAKRAFNALCHSTHLYGRRLVLEWAEVEADDIETLRRKTAAHFHEGGPAKKFKKSTIMEDLLKTSGKDDS